MMDVVDETVRRENETNYVTSVIQSTVIGWNRLVPCRVRRKDVRKFVQGSNLYK